MANFQELSKELCKKGDFKKLKEYVALIESENQKYNLTAFKGEKLWKEGIYDSLFSLSEAQKILPKDFSMLDIGAGAGFPSIPYLICHPQVKLTILEPQKKKVHFLNLLKENLDLDFTLFPYRCESFRKREEYHLITARALMPLRQLVEATIHLGNLNTWYWFIKGKNLATEIAESQRTLEFFNVKWSSKELKHLPEKNNQIFFYQKGKKEPRGFPREWAKIKNKPI